MQSKKKKPKTKRGKMQSKKKKPITLTKEQIKNDK